ncbi:MAG: PAS domain S-box protein, partial [Microcoleaceae cyanobacterium]
MARNSQLINSLSLEQAIESSPVIVKPEISVAEAIARLNQSRKNSSVANSATQVKLTCLLVAENSQLLGILTESDLVRLLANCINLTNIKIEEVMTRGVVTLKSAENQDIFTILKLFSQHKISHLPIIEETGKLIGIISKNSLRACLQAANLLRWKRVGEVMTENVICIAPTTELLTVSQQMVEDKISSLVIAEINSTHPLRPLGLITQRDILQLQAEGIDFYTTNVQTVINSPPLCVTPETSLWVAHQQMQQHQVSRLLVCSSEGELQGIITQTNLLAATDPTELYSIIHELQQQNSQLEAEKIAALETHTALLTASNQALKKEISDRQEAEASLKSLSEQLETIVKKRTAELEKTNARLRQEIRKRQEIEESLRRNQKYYAALTEVVPVGIFSTDSQGNIVYVNQQWYKITGLLPETALGQGWAKCIHPEERETTFNTWYSYVYNQPSKFTHECRLLKPSGEIVWADTQAVPEVDDNGEIIGFVGTVTDITQQKQAEFALQQLNAKLETKVAQRTTQLQKLNQELIQEIGERQQVKLALQQNQQFLQTIADSAPILIYIFDIVEMRNVYLNGQTLKIMGYSATEIQALGNRLFPTLAHPDDLPAVNQNIQRNLATAADGQVIEIEYRFRHKNGQWRWFRSYDTVFKRNADGRVRQIIGTALDISDRKHTESALRESESRYRNLFENSYDAIFIHNKQGKIIEVNYRACELLQYSREELLSMEIYALHPEQISSDIFSKLNEAIKRTGKAEFEIQLRRKDRTIIDVEVSTGIIDLETDIFQVIVRDVSERKRAEAAVKLAHLSLELAGDMIFSTNSEARFINVNEAVCHQLGYSQSELLQMGIYDFDRNFSTAAWSEKWQQLKSGKFLTYELVIYTKNDREMVVEIKISHLEFADKEYACAIARNITDRKQAEEHLRQSEAEHRATFEYAPIGICYTTLAGKYFKVNQRFCDL